ncbi:MAG TPA: lipoyl(octanoyl) transferase LipB [Candidatus Limnocylindrales bacterium]|nr:lipoyl(octanoyl) transferase LipB [Candidatus Limnocylindrales bacterium]
MLLTTDLGLLSWSDAYALQERIVAARKAGAIDDVLLFCEHPHVLTLGRSASQKNLLASENVLRQKNVELRETNRGGDVTYHGPGQIVGYPILNLDSIRRDIHWYVRTLEEAMIRASADFGISAYRIPGKTGIWVQPPGNIPEEKLAAIGVHISRWVTSHGFAFNVSTDLRYFDLIIPCGIPDRKATSLEKLLHRTVALDEVKSRLIHHLSELFSLTPREVPPQKLFAALDCVGFAFRLP